MRIGSTGRVSAALLALGIITLCHPTLALAQPEISVKRLTETDEVEITLRSLIRAPSSAVESVLTNYAAYREITPGMIRSNVLSQGPEGTLVDHEINLPWPVSNLQTRTFFYDATDQADGRHLRWYTDQTRATRMQGHYHLVDLGDQTQFTQVMRITLSSNVPFWVLKWGVERILPDYSLRLEAQARSRTVAQASATQTAAF